jgi:hypothetical protein
LCCFTESFQPLESQPLRGHLALEDLDFLLQILKRIDSSQSGSARHGTSAGLKE